jgi:uncharacterized protein (TIGR02996 family)
MVAYATSRDIVFINLETGQEKYILSNKDTYSIVHLAYALDGMTRLVYADWLDENGYAEEAEFIRIQCRLYSWLDRDFCFCPQCGKRMKNLRERMLVLFSEIKNNDILFSLNEILSIFGEISFLRKSTNIFFHRFLITLKFRVFAMAPTAARTGAITAPIAPIVNGISTRVLPASFLIIIRRIFPS